MWHLGWNPEETSLGNLADLFPDLNLNFPTDQSGWGITTMKERAATLGGSVDIKSEPGQGTRIITEFRR